MNLILLTPSDYTDDTHVTLADRRFIHIRDVHRSVVGETLRVGNVNGSIGTGQIVELSDRAVTLQVSCTADPAAPLPITLVLALPRPKVLRRLVECITAMGVKELYLLETWRVEKSYWSSPFLSEGALTEYRMKGLEQACDTIVPNIYLRKQFRPFVEDELPALVKNTAAYVLHPASPSPCPVAIREPLVLAIGPEGGFIPFEIDLLKKTGFADIRFGDRILRVEQVVPAVMGRLQLFH